LTDRKVDECYQGLRCYDIGFANVYRARYLLRR
jgi:hypothetical protein